MHGPKICDFDGVSYYAFPDAEKLAAPEVEGQLRSASFGYRAKFIQKSASEVLAKSNLEWFHKLQLLGYKDAHQELTQLTGIGPKAEMIEKLLAEKKIEIENQLLFLFLFWEKIEELKEP